jgi:hypothetical protein
MKIRSRRFTQALFGGLVLAACVLTSIGALAQPTGPVLRPFSVHDLDRDGYLSRAEYRALLELRRLRHERFGRVPPQPAPAFDEVDVDRDAFISEDELTDVLRHKMYRYRRRGPRWTYPPAGD